MKTVQLEIYQFDELSKRAKGEAIEKLRERFGYYCEDVLDEAKETAKVFCDKFRIRTGRNGWLDYRNHQNKELTGLRLRIWLINNHGSLFYRRKSKYTKTCKWRYSKVFWEHATCPLTGVYFDDEVLKPLYSFVHNYRGVKNAEYLTLDDLFMNCLESLRVAIENEVDYRKSEEFLLMGASKCSLYFLESGEIWED